MVLDCGDETLWVDREVVRFFFVWVDFFVLVWDSAFFECDPGALDEWAELMEKFTEETSMICKLELKGS